MCPHAEVFYLKSEKCYLPYQITVEPPLKSQVRAVDNRKSVKSDKSERAHDSRRV
jgi:hypothetical protein